MAQEIVSRWNAHDDLLAACKDGEMAIKNLCEYLAGRIAAPDSIKTEKAVTLIQAVLEKANKINKENGEKEE